MNLADHEGWTPIMLASRGGHVRVIEILVQQEASLFGRSRDNSTELHMAVKNGHLEACRVLLANAGEAEVGEEGCAPILFDGIRGGHHAIVKLLLATTPSFIEETYDGGFALHLTAELGALEMMELVSNITQCVDNVNNTYMTPLMVAAKHEHTRVVKRLLVTKAKVNGKDYNGNGALHFAAQCDCRRICQALLKSEADLNAKNSSGHTQLMVAALEGHSEMVEFLLKRGADIDASGTYERTTLHHAVAHGELAHANVLVDFGADVETVDARGIMPFMTAAEEENTNAMKLLVSRWVLFLQRKKVPAARRLVYLV